MPAKRRTLHFTLFFSAILHGLLLFSLTMNPPAPKPRPLPLQLEIKEARAAPSTGRARTHRLGSRAKRTGIRLSDLTPKLSLDPALQPPPADDSIPASWADAKAYLGMSSNSAGSLTRLQTDFVRALWQAIDNEISDNPSLSEYNHTGQVFVRFEVNANGALVPRSLHASARDRVLKVIALKALRRALKDVPADAHFSHEWTLINASFSWASYAKCQDLRGSQRNYLSFCHYAEDKRKKFTTGERVFHHANAIYNHGPWAVEEIKQYNREERHRNEDYDPFEDLRRDPDWNL